VWRGGGACVRGWRGTLRQDTRCAFGGECQLHVSLWQGLQLIAPGLAGMGLLFRAKMALVGPKPTTRPKCQQLLHSPPATLISCCLAMALSRRCFTRASSPSAMASASSPRSSLPGLGPHGSPRSLNLCCKARPGWVRVSVSWWVVGGGGVCERDHPSEGASQQACIWVHLNVSKSEMHG